MFSRSCPRGMPVCTRGLGASGLSLVLCDWFPPISPRGPRPRGLSLGTRYLARENEKVEVEVED